MLIKGFSCFSSSGHFVQWSKTIRGSFKEHFFKNYFEIGPLAYE